MSRRKDDKSKSRLILGLIVLTALSSILSIVIGYKAISAMDRFNEFLDAAMNRASSPLKESF